MRRPSLPTRRPLAAVAACLLIGAVVPAGSQAAPTLLHWYKADGDATDAVLGPDASNGTFIDDARIGPGRSGEAFAFDGADDRITIPSNASFYPSGSATLEAWATTITSAPLGGLIPLQIASLYECANLCPSNANAVFELEIRNGRAYGFVRDDDASGPPDQNGGQVITGGPLINDGAFHHIVLIRDIETGVLALYVDDLEVAEAALNAGADGPLSNTDGETDPFTIGAQLEGGTTNPVDEFSGSIDDVRLWSGALYEDKTPPGYIPVISGTAGDNGWYRSAVTVSWQVLDESIIRTRSGCDPATVTASVTLTCSASSAGGSSSGSIGLKLDTAGPTVSCEKKPTFLLGTEGSVSAAVADPNSGPVATSVSGPAATADDGSFTVSLTGRDSAGNTTTVECPYAVALTRSVAIGQIATLPGAKRCVSRRLLRIRLRDVKAAEIVGAQVRLGTKTVRVLKGKALSLPIDLRGLPKGRFKVTLSVTNADGAKRVGTRTYRTCVPRRTGR